MHHTILQNFSKTSIPRASGIMLLILFQEQFSDRFMGNVIAMATQKLFTEQPHCSSTDNTQLHPDRKPLTSGAEATSNRDNRDPGKPPQKKTSVQILEPEYKGYTIIKVEEKHGPLHNAIPCMPLLIAIICCIINIFVPGIGKCDATIFLGGVFVNGV